jgi:vacuolar-type H+-ATPase subunit H
LETAREEAAAVKTREIERIRLEEIEKSKLIIKQAEKTASEITSINTDKVSKKLFNEFISAIGG